MNESFVPGLLGGLAIALVAAPMGCFILWRRMVFFGAAVAHSALLGVALGLVLGINLTAGVILTAVAVAVILVLLRRDKRLPDDTILGVVAHATLAFGLIALAFLGVSEGGLEEVMFGDIGSINYTDLLLIFACGGVGLVVLNIIWETLLAMTIHEELAIVEGAPASLIRLIFMLMLAVFVGLALKVVGALLIISLLIIPAAAARRLATGPETMVVIAAGIGGVSVLGGIQGHLAWNLPAGPVSVAVTVLAFGCTFILGPLLGKRASNDS